MAYTTPTDTAREYLRKDEYARMPRLKLARILYKDHPLVYTGTEHARTVLRRVAGKSGNAKQTAMGKNKEFSEVADRPRNPYSLPHSDETTFEPFVFPHYKRIAVLSDIHIPFHSISALTAVLDYYKKEKPDALFLNGDIIDCYQLSRFDKDPRKRSFGAELEAFADTLKKLRDVLKCPVYYKYGNHEERYEHFLFAKAKELVGVEEFELDAIIKKRVPDITIIKDKRIVKIGGKDEDGVRVGALSVVHGHEFGGGFFSPVNVARGLFLRAKSSAMQGHSHQTSEHSERDLNGKLMTCWSLGCLCELYPDYAKFNKWNHGYAEILVNDDGTWDVRNKRIVNGKIL